MNNAQEKLKRAQDIFQSLNTEQQLEIKTQQPDTYRAIFSNDIIPNTYYLEAFIKKYSDTPVEDQIELNLSAETKAMDFKNAKFNNVPTDIAKSRDLFSGLSEDIQLSIKNNKPEIYNMLFKNNVFVDQSALSAFVQEYSKDNSVGKTAENSNQNNFNIKSYEDFDRLQLSAQVDFKNKFPDEYNKILGIKKK